MRLAGRWLLGVGTALLLAVWPVFAATANAVEFVIIMSGLFLFASAILAAIECFLTSEGRPVSRLLLSVGLLVVLVLFVITIVQILAAT